MAFLSPSNVEEVRETLRRIQKNLECPICLELLSDPYSTQCSHPFCRTCIYMVISSNKEARCPLCKESISKRSMNENSRLADIVEAVKVLERAITKDSGVPSTPPRSIPDNHSHEATGTPGIVMHSLLHPTPHKPPLAEGVRGGTLKCDSVGGNRSSVHKPSTSSSNGSRTRRGKRVRFAPPTKRQSSSRRSTTDQAALLQALQEVEFAEPHCSVDDREGHMDSERNGGEGHMDSERNGGEGHVDSERNGGEGHVVAERNGREGHVDSERNGGEGHMDSERNGGEGHMDSERNGGEGYVVAERNGGEGHEMSEEGGRNGREGHEMSEEGGRNGGEGHEMSEEGGRNGGEGHEMSEEGRRNGREGHVDLERTVLSEKGGHEETSDMTGLPPRKKHRTDNETTNQSSYNKVLEIPAADIATGSLSPAVASAGDLTGYPEKKPHTPNTQCRILTETPWLVPGSTCVPKLHPTPAIDSNCRTILETPFIGADKVAVVGKTPFTGADMVAVVGETPFIGADMVAVVGETPFIGADMVAVVGKTPFTGADKVAVVGETPFTGADKVAVVGETPFIGADMVAVVGETPFIGADMVAVVGETPFIGADMVAVVGETPFIGADKVAVVGETPLVGVPPEAMEILAKESQYSDTLSSIDSHREPFPTIEETQMPIGGSEVLVCNEAMNAHSSISSSSSSPQNVEPDLSHLAVSNHHTISPTCPGQTQCVAETQFTKAASPEDKQTNTEWNEHANEVDADMTSPAITREIVHTPHCSKEDLNTTASTTPDLDDLLKESPTTIRESPDQIPVTRSPPPSVASFLSPPNSLASQSLLNHSISPSIPLQNTGSGIPERTVVPDTLGAPRCHSTNEHGSIPSSQKSPVYPSTDTMLPGLYSCGIHRATAVPGTQQSTNSVRSHKTKSFPMKETTIKSAYCQMEPPMTPASGMLDNCLSVIPDSLLFHEKEHSPLPGSVSQATPDSHICRTEHSPLPGSVSQAKGTPDSHICRTEHSPLPGSVAIDSQPLITSRSEELLSECSSTQWDIMSSVFTQELTSQEVESLKRQMEEKQREIQELEEALLQARQDEEPDIKSCLHKMDVSPPPKMDVSLGRPPPKRKTQAEGCHQNITEVSQPNSSRPGATLSEISQPNSSRPGATSPEVNVIADSYPTAYSTGPCPQGTSMTPTSAGSGSKDGPIPTGCDVAPVERVIHLKRKREDIFETSQQKSDPKRKREDIFETSQQKSDPKRKREDIFETSQQKSDPKRKKSQQRENVERRTLSNHSPLPRHSTTQQVAGRKRPNQRDSPANNTLHKTFKKSSPGPSSSDKTPRLLEAADKLIKELRSPPSIVLDSKATVEVDSALLMSTPRTQHKTSSTKKQTHKVASSYSLSNKKKVPLVVLNSQDVENYSPTPPNIPLPGNHPFLTISTTTPIPYKETTSPGLALKHHTLYKEKATPSSITPYKEKTTPSSITPCKEKATPSSITPKEKTTPSSITPYKEKTTPSSTPCKEKTTPSSITPYKEKATPSITPAVKPAIMETPHIPLSGSHRPTADESPQHQNEHVPSFVGSGLSKPQLKQSQLLAKKFGGRIASCFNGSTTHVIVLADENGNCTRTVKYLQGIAAGKWILDYKWIEDSLKAGSLLPESMYEVKGDLVSGSNAPQRAHKAKTIGDPGFFHQHNFLLAGHFSTISHEHLSQLIQLGNGTLISDSVKFLPRIGSRNVVVCDEADALTTLSLSCDEYSIVTSSWVIDSLSEYRLLPLTKYKLNEQ